MPVDLRFPVHDPVESESVCYRRERDGEYFYPGSLHDANAED